MWLTVQVAPERITMAEDPVVMGDLGGKAVGVGHALKSEMRVVTSAM